MDARGQASEYRGATAGGGHNVGDDPSFTEPEMYRRIEELRPIRKRYLEKLVDRSDLSLEEGEQHLKEFRERLDRIFDEIPRGEESAAPAETSHPDPLPRPSPSRSSRRPSA
jgi:multifunctional 2-oxoglutarate metabolism enzyme